MAYQCPHCQGKVLSRRSGRCGHCGNPLPAEILMTATELERVEAAERDRERRREERAEMKQRRLETLLKSFGGDGGG
jgi:DNA-directed RNA polymerase subunit RPC12/RpoP